MTVDDDNDSIKLLAGCSIFVVMLILLVISLSINSHKQKVQHEKFMNDCLQENRAYVCTGMWKGIIRPDPSTSPAVFKGK